MAWAAGADSMIAIAREQLLKRFFIISDSYLQIAGQCSLKVTR